MGLLMRGAVAAFAAAVESKVSELVAARAGHGSASLLRGRPSAGRPSAGAFLAGGVVGPSPPANVRVVAADAPFPSAASLAEARRRPAASLVEARASPLREGDAEAPGLERRPGNVSGRRARAFRAFRACLALAGVGRLFPGAARYVAGGDRLARAEPRATCPSARRREAVNSVAAEGLQRVVRRVLARGGRWG
eukprot:1352475-Alexandrium_andersonii.AAC.1